MKNLTWWFSRTARQADQMRKHVKKILSAQRDLLSAQAIDAVEAAMRSMKEAVANRIPKDALLKEMEKLEKVADKWLKPYPSATMRENIEVLLVAIAVAMGIRTFFLQPFKIPTGSMQPTLYGITSNPDFHQSRAFPQDLGPSPDFDIPNRLQRLISFWINGVSYTHVVAKSEGSLQDFERPKRFALFTLWQRFQVGDDWYTVWFPPEDLLARSGLVSYFGQRNPKVFKPGEDIIKIKVVSGDHLFVDRLTFNFRRPKRGEIIVFETTGIDALPQNQFYIKRLVALGGEKVRIGNDRHLIIDGKRLDSSTPHFEFVYSFNGPPKESTFSGHVNQFVADENGFGSLAGLFPTEATEVQIKPNHYMVMGDNTVNSSDSRTWGDFPREKVIGKSFFVYWPIGTQDGRGSRFGWGHQ